MSWRPHKGTLSGDDKPSCARTHRSVLPPPWFDMEHLQDHQDPAVKSFQHCTASPPLEQERECREAGAAPLRTSPRNVDEGRTGCRLVRSREGIAACCLSPLPQSARHAKRALKLLKKSAIVLRQQTRAQTRAIVWGRNVLVALVLLISGLDFVQGSEVTAFAPANGPPTGGFTLTVFGAELGSSSWCQVQTGDCRSDIGRSRSFAIRIGGTSCEETNWQSFTSMSCRMSSGFQPSNIITATVRFTEGIALGSRKAFSNSNNKTLSFSYDQPTLVDPVVNNGPATGDTNITLFGKNFLIVDATPRAALGFTACSFTRWISDTIIVAKNSPSVLEHRSSVITLQERRETRVNQFCYDRATLTAIYATNSKTAGQISITLVGQDFGNVDWTQRVRVGDTNCLASGWVADSTVLCKLPDDTKVNLGVTFSVALRTATLSRAMSYDLPRLTAVFPPNIPLNEARRITLLGYNFGGGLMMKRKSARLGDTSCLAMQWKSDTSISCLSQPGYAQDLFITVTIAETKVKEQLLSYNYPLITAVQKSNGPASGSDEFTIFGRAFGVFELTPQVHVGGTACMRTQWIAESTVICKAPRVSYDKWFMGDGKALQIRMGSSMDRADNAYTYDMACVGPCVIALACKSSTGARGCNGPSHGDYRHPLLADDRQLRNFNKELVLRIIGNFTLYRTTTEVLVGNTTDNKTVTAMEQIYNGDVKISFGDEPGMYDCLPDVIPGQPKSPASSTVQQYVDCVLPMGVGHGHSIKITIRNATFRALLDGCTAEMRNVPTTSTKAGAGIWPPLKPGESNPGKERQYGNCFLPDSLDDEYAVADDIGVSFSFSAPIVTKLEPSAGLNSLAFSVDLTITGTNFGGETRRVWGPQCRKSQSRSCRLMFQNAVTIFNVSCKNVNLMLSPSTGAAMEKENERKQLAYCKTEETFMLKCSSPFAEKNQRCETVGPIGVFCQSTPDRCRTFCSEQTIVCQSLPMGGLQQINVIVADQAADNTLTFSYAAPVLYEVFPPELAAGTGSKLTVRGMNFGVDMPSRYAGRQYLDGSFDSKGNKAIALNYDKSLVPFNQSSISWWEIAQYSACFSTQVDGNNETSVYKRICDQGQVFSRQTALSHITEETEKEDGTKSLFHYDEMLIQGPAVNLKGGQTVVSVDVIVQSMGGRSQVAPSNSTLRFRASCSSIDPKILSVNSLWYIGVGGNDFTARYGAVFTSFQNKIWMFAGETKSDPQLNEIYTSSHNGVSMWSPEARNFEWWPPRVNTTVVVHKDILYLMLGTAKEGDDSYSCFQDQWVYANTKEIADYYSTANTKKPQLARGQTFQAFWIEIHRDLVGTKPEPRHSAYAVSFKGRAWLIGGMSCAPCLRWNQLDKCEEFGEARVYTDVWSSADFRKWRRDLATAPWQGRNNIFAAVHDGAIYVVASVQQQFYNTFYSTDGISYVMRENACALTNVDIVAVLSFSSYLLAFTIGCHNQLDFNQVPVECDHRYAGPLENRIFATKDGKLWSLTLTPFNVDFFDRAVHKPFPWAAGMDAKGNRIIGEIRYNFRVTAHMNTLYIVGGQMLKAPLDNFGNPFKDPDDPKKNYIQVQPMNDVWVSKGLVLGPGVCVDKFDQGLSQSQTVQRVQAKFGDIPCKLAWDINRVRWKSKIEIDFERGYTRRNLALHFNRRMLPINIEAPVFSANAMLQPSLRQIEKGLACLKPGIRKAVLDYYASPTSSFTFSSLSAFLTSLSAFPSTKNGSSHVADVDADGSTEAVTIADVPNGNVNPYPAQPEDVDTVNVESVDDLDSEVLVIHVERLWKLVTKVSEHVGTIACAETESDSPSAQNSAH